MGGEWKSKRWGRDHLDSCVGKRVDRKQLGWRRKEEKNKCGNVK